MTLFCYRLLRCSVFLVMVLCGTSPVLAADITPPTVSIVLSDYALKIGETATVTFTFSEAVTGFSIADLSTHKAVFSNLSSSDFGTTWTATLTPNSDTKYQSKVTADLTGVFDLAGNQGEDLTDSAIYTVDNIAPVISTEGFVVLKTALKIGDTTTVQIRFAEKVTGFTLADLTADNAVVTSLTTADGGLTWTATLTPNSDTNSASNTVTFDLAGVTDLAGNAGVGPASSINYAVDTARPALDGAISLSDEALKIGDTATVTFTFTEAVTDFSTADIAVQSGSLSELRSTDGGITWTAILTPDTTTTAGLNKITLTLTGLADLAGNAGVGSSDSANYSVDTVPPAISGTITLSDNALTLGETATVTFSFVEAVTEFTSDDVTVENGSLSNLTPSNGGLIWTATLTPDALISHASNVLTLDMAGITDTAGNTGIGTQDSGNYTVDTAPPTLVITIADTSLTIGETTTVTFTFSEVVSGFANADVTVPSGSLSNVTSLDNITFTATFTPATTTDVDNIISVDMTGLTDLASNAGKGSTNSGTYGVDLVRPALVGTMTISDTILTPGQTATVTITFSEAVTGFSAADIVAQNGVLTDLASSDGGFTWTATLTPDANITAAESNILTLDLTSVADLVGNAGTGSSTSGNYGVYTAPVSVVITLSDSALTLGTTATVTFSFNTIVYSFNSQDITLANATLSNLDSRDGGKIWTATLTPDAEVNAPTNVITVHLDGVTNFLEIWGTGTQDSDNYAVNTVSPDTKPPTVQITLSDDALKIGDTSTVTLTFSEAITGLALGDMTADNGTLSNLIKVSDTVYTATLTPSTAATDASNIVTLDMTVIYDLAENSGVGLADSGNYAVDTVGPAISGTITLTDSELAIGETATVTFTFSEAVTGFNTEAVTVGHGTLSNLATADGGITWTAILTPSESVFSSTNVLTLDMSLLTDLAGNSGKGTQDSGNYAVDTVAPDTMPPSLVITMSDSGLSIGETATVTFTFSEAVTGFDLVDISAAHGGMTNLTSLDNITFTATFTPDTATTDSSNTISVEMSGVADLASNAGLGSSSSPNYVVDTTPQPPVITGPSGSAGDSTSAISINENLISVAQFTAASQWTVGWDLEGDDKSLFAIDSDGNLTFIAAPDYENPFGADNIYSVTVKAYNGYTQSGQAVTVTVLNVDETPPADRDPPTLSSMTLADSQLTLGETTTVTFTFSEAIKGFTLSDMVTPNAYFSEDPVSSDGGITWIATLHAAAGVDASVNNIRIDMTRVADLAENAGINYADGDAYSVYTIVSPTAGPMITGPTGGAGAANSASSMSENHGTVATFSADVSVTWTLQGQDAALFQIDRNGNLTFRSTPDFENPADLGGNNIYDVAVIATDGDSQFAIQNVTVYVLDVDEAQPIGDTTLADVLGKDLSRTLSEQQARMDQIAKAVLERLRQGPEAPCGVIKAVDVSGPIDIHNGAINTNGTFGSDVNDCAQGLRRLTLGDFALSSVSGQGATLTLNFDHLREGFANAQDLHGQFWGGYLRQSNIDAAGASGKILGFGMRAGLYGARALGDGMSLDYYQAVAAGYHRFDLDIADGGYSYGAAFGGAALSGAFQLQGMTVIPRIGAEYGLGRDMQGDNLDRPTVPTAKSARVFAEMSIVQPFAATMLGQLQSQLTLEPRLYCDVLGGVNCALGGAVSISQTNAKRGSNFLCKVLTEPLDGQDKLSLHIEGRRVLGDNLGTISWGMSMDSNQDVKLNQNLEIKF